MTASFDFRAHLKTVHVCRFITGTFLRFHFFAERRPLVFVSFRKQKCCRDALQRFTNIFFSLQEPKDGLHIFQKVSSLCNSTSPLRSFHKLCPSYICELEGNIWFIYIAGPRFRILFRFLYYAEIFHRFRLGFRFQTSSIS